VVCTTSRRLIALDPATGQQRWVYDPKSKLAGMRKCRGVSAWTDDAAPKEALCSTRIFLGTADYRLVAIDSKSGKLCPDFGDHGEVQMKPSKPEILVGEVSAGLAPRNRQWGGRRRLDRRGRSARGLAQRPCIGVRCAHRQAEMGFDPIPGRHPIRPWRLGPRVRTATAAPMYGRNGRG